MGYNDEIAPLRDKINDIDTQMIALFEARMNTAKAIADVKKTFGKAIFDSQREETVIDRALSLLKDKSLSDETRSFIRAMMDISKERQHKSMPAPPPMPFSLDTGDAVGYLGLPGSFSHIAASQAFGDTNALRNYPTFEAIFEAMKAGDITYAILPAENTETGSVTAAIDLLAKYGNYIVAEKLLAVRHSLLGPSGASIDDIKKVYSHPQPLAQCRTFLTQHPAMQTYPASAPRRPRSMLRSSAIKASGVSRQPRRRRYTAWALSSRTSRTTTKTARASLSSPAIRAATKHAIKRASCSWSRTGPGRCAKR